MTRRLAFLTKLLVLVSLILASMPAGATETVCVVGTKKQVVAMRKCGMPCCAHRAPAPKQASCCKPKAALSQECGANLNCHCETRYVATSMPAPVADTKLYLFQPVLSVLGTEIRLVSNGESALIQETAVVETDVDPPRKVPRAPMRGRAPPVTNL